MDLYFSPLACSLATRISLYEAGAQASFIEVDPKTKRIMHDSSDYLNVYLSGRDFLLDRFTVADAYLYTVLNWSMATPVKFDRFPAIAAYFDRLKKRPSVAKAFGEELALYKAEQARHKQAA